jgi:hypothetical protein
MSHPKHPCFQRPEDYVVQQLLDNSINSVQREQNCTRKIIMFLVFLGKSKAGYAVRGTKTF